MLKEHIGVDIRVPKKRDDWIRRMLIKHGAGSLTKITEKVDQTVMDLGASTAVSSAGPVQESPHSPSFLKAKNQKRC